MDTEKLLKSMEQVLLDKKAADIVSIDISQTSGFADYFILATAGSLRQLAALCDELEDKMAEQEYFVRHIEGKGESGWILMDFGDIVVNLFTEKQREHYQIERIWNDCPITEVKENE